MSEAKPCPFCGSEAVLETQFGREWWVQCTNTECNAAGSTIELTPQDAQAWWDRRATPAATGENRHE